MQSLKFWKYQSYLENASTIAGNQVMILIASLAFNFSDSLMEAIVSILLLSLKI